jgi:uncharacterized protein (TIGR03437 family)
VESAGNLYIADKYNYRVRKVSSGVITTVAGNGTGGFSGDNGPATSAELADPRGVAVDSAGDVYIASVGANRIRILTPSGSRCTYSVSPASLRAPASGGVLTVTIQAAASCPWGVSGLPGWITVSGASSGPVSASVAPAVFPNNSGAPLSVTVLVAGVSVTIAQPALITAPLLPIQVWIAGQQALYTYAGEAPGMVEGVMQLNVQIPADAPPGALPIQVSIGGNMSQNGTTLTVQ